MSQEEEAGDFQSVSVWSDGSDMAQLDDLPRDSEEWLELNEAKLAKILGEHAEMNDAQHQEMLFEELMNDENEFQARNETTSCR